MKRRFFALIAADIIGFLLAFCLSLIVLILRNVSDLEIVKTISFDLVGLYIILAGIGILYFMQQGHYRLSAPWWEQTKHILTFSLIAILSLSFYYFFIKGHMSRLLIISSWAFVMPCLITLRQMARHFLLSRDIWRPKTIIIGGFENTIETLFALKSENYINYDVKTIIIPKASKEKIERFSQIHEGYEAQTEIPAFEKETLVIICPDTRRELKLEHLTQDIMEAGANFAVVPPIEGFSYYGLQPHFFFGYNIVLLLRSRNISSILNKVAKNSIDRIGAAFGLLILFPLFLYIAFKVKQDGGSVFYGHKRLGRNGKVFKCWKFRSMVVNSQQVLDELLESDPDAKAEWDRDFKLKNDPRITKIGATLRTTSLDEIPQLFNVLLGDMSLVGPRPIVEGEVKYYGDKIRYYYSVRPGVTGLWQVSGRNDISYDLRVYLDRWYVRHWSLWTDIVIIFKTIFVVALKRGAY